MKINLKASIDLTNIELLEFLSDTSKKDTDVFTIDNSIPTGYIFEDGGVKILDEAILDSNFKYENNVTFLIKEYWIVKRIKTTFNEIIGENFAVVVYLQPFVATLEFRVYFKVGILEVAKNYGKDLLQKYNYLINGDLQTWIKANLDFGLTEEMFIVDTAINVRKKGIRQEVDISQRKALKIMYGIDPIIDKDHYRTKIWLEDYYNNEGNLERWSKENNIQLFLDKEELLTNSLKPETSKVIKEITKGDLSETIENDLISIIINSVTTLECGKMRYPAKVKLLTLYTIPEFMIEFHETSVEVGCVWITITYPVLKIRDADYNFYVYYSVPESITQSLLLIAKNCAVNAALAGGVLGIITGNPSVALVTFINGFEYCVKDQIVKCMNPGLLTIKEVTSWR
jgi:hypothetical protein